PPDRQCPRHHRPRPQNRRRHHLHHPQRPPRHGRGRPVHRSQSRQDTRHGPQGRTDARGAAGHDGRWRRTGRTEQFARRHDIEIAGGRRWRPASHVHFGDIMTDTIGVGLIGTGYMGKCHALAWTSVKAVFGDGPRPALVHLAEVNAEIARQKADEFGFAKATGDWRELIADPAVEVVSVTTPNAFHAEMAIAALEAGKHVWCEKPMAVALADAERMAEAAKASGKTAILGYNYIQNPLIRQIGVLLAEGAIGEVNHVRLEMDEDFMADPEALFYWKSEASSGYGALDDF